jgi:hypothetical protein
MRPNSLVIMRFFKDEPRVHERGRSDGGGKRTGSVSDASLQVNTEADVDGGYNQRHIDLCPLCFVVRPLSD